MLSKTGLHAVRAMIALARLPAREYAGAGTIAEAVGSPQNYLSKLLKDLALQGLLESQKGLGGGFRLAKPSKAITLLDIVDPIEHLNRWSGCILGQTECSEIFSCPIHSRWKAVRDSYISMLQRTTLAEVATKEEPLTIESALV